MCAGPPGTASPATAELYLFRKLLSPCPDGSRSNARARRDLAHWADQASAKAGTPKFSGISSHNHYYRRYVRWSNEYFPKLGVKSRPGPNGCDHSGLVAEQCSALGQRDGGGGCTRTILDA